MSRGVETITKDIALDLINSVGSEYRLTSRDYVTTLARVMSEGRWRNDNGQAILVTSDGRLVDGRHRLSAVLLLISNGVVNTFDMMVERGIPSDVMGTIDKARKRTLADDVRLSGYQGNGTAMAALMTRLWYWDRKIYNTRLTKIRPSSEEVSTTYPITPVMDELLKRANVGAHQIDMSAAQLAFVWMLFYRISKKDADSFMEQLVNGNNLDWNDPRLIARKRLRKENEEARRHGYHYSGENRIAIVILAWNVWRRGETTTGFQITGETVSNEKFPQPF